MLNECKLALRITHPMYEPELCRLMDAGARDLSIAGVKLPGTVAFEVTESGMQDNSTLTDALVQTAIFTYVRAHFGSPADEDKLVEAYNVQKCQLMHATGYTDYGEPVPEGGDGDGQS